MGAIAGVCGKTTQHKVIGSMLSTMKRRGPNGEVFMTDQDCCLIETRSRPGATDAVTQCVLAGECFTIVLTESFTIRMYCVGN